MQALAEPHDTPDRTLPLLPGSLGLGVGGMDHEVPSQASASVTWTPGPVLASPTAVQALAEVHDTAESSPPSEGAGGGWMDHGRPFHPSASVPAFELPTAVQASGAAHDAPDRLAAGTAGACSM